jgi:hypothetical protein
MKRKKIIARLKGKLLSGIHMKNITMSITMIMHMIMIGRSATTPAHSRITPTTNGLHEIFWLPTWV